VVGFKVTQSRKDLGDLANGVMPRLNKAVIDGLKIDRNVTDVAAVAYIYFAFCFFGEEIVEYLFKYLKAWVVDW